MFIVTLDTAHLLLHFLNLMRLIFISFNSYTKFLTSVVFILIRDSRLIFDARSWCWGVTAITTPDHIT